MYVRTVIPTMLHIGHTETDDHSIAQRVHECRGHRPKARELRPSWPWLTISQGQGNCGPFTVLQSEVGQLSLGEKVPVYMHSYECGSIVCVRKKLETTQCPSGVARERNAKWYSYSVPRYTNVHNLCLELQSYDKIIRETKDGPDV